jgi:hypothetical protein
MITNFKIFENKKIRKPKLNDWVLIKLRRKNLIDYIGKITHINKKSNYPYLIEFDDDFDPNIYGFFNANFTGVMEDEILYWSENKEVLETILAANKYNL